MSLLVMGYSIVSCLSLSCEGVTSELNFMLLCLPQVLKKADMIRKNAVESILAERDILISVRNPFVVSRSTLQSILTFHEKFLFHSNMNMDLVRFASFIHLLVVTICIL